MADEINRFVGQAGGVIRNYIVADTDASKPSGTTAGDVLYAVDTDTFYTWTGSAWSKGFLFTYGWSEVSVCPFATTEDSYGQVNLASVSRNGKVVVVLILGAGESIAHMYVSVDSGITWTLAAASGTGSWSCVALSDDGGVIYAGEASNRLYKSINYGASWTEVRPDGNNDRQWISLATDSDGSVVLTCDTLMLKLWLSTDSGANWSEMQPTGAGGSAYMLVLVDGDGSVLVAGINGGRLYLSTNAGAGWSETQPAGVSDGGWATGTISIDGARILVPSSGVRVWYTSNTGGAWTEKRPNGDTNFNWYSVAMSDDGVTMILGEPASNPVLEYGGKLYKSIDTGDNFAEIQPLGDTYQFWGSAGCSSDATVIAVSASYGNDNNSSGKFLIYSEERLVPQRLPLFSNIQVGAVPMVDEESNQVLSGRGWKREIGYALTFNAANLAVQTDAQTVYWGAFFDQVPTTTTQVRRMYIPRTGHIKACYIYLYCTGSGGSNQDWSMYIKKNGGSSTLVETVSTAATERLWSNILLDIFVLSGDFIEIEEVQPTWVTNPANVKRWGIVYIES
jgi:hypothetical protein